MNALLSPPNREPLVFGAGSGFVLGLLAENARNRVFPRRDEQSASRATLHSAGRVTREELGRCTWTLLHALAAQFPERPSRAQQRDAGELFSLLGRVYPCRECAAHWAELVRRHPPRTESRENLSEWLCDAHNRVNDLLGKPRFNCARADARWSMERCREDVC
jgi:FAD-linked sulfhydryl oxidase